MIESEIVRAERVSVYPKMMVGEFDEVVLFSSKHRGTVVFVKGASGNVVGNYSNSWRMDTFKDLESGTVVSIKQC